MCFHIYIHFSSHAGLVDVYTFVADKRIVLIVHVNVSEMGTFGSPSL